MAKCRQTNEKKLMDPAVHQDGRDRGTTAHPNMDSDDECEELSLEEILTLYNQPINEEQAWAVCYQCCRSLADGHRRRNSKSAGAKAVGSARRIEGPGDVRIYQDGVVRLQQCSGPGKFPLYLLSL